MAQLEGGSGGSGGTPSFTGRMTSIDGTNYEIWQNPMNGSEFLVQIGESRPNRYDTTGYGQSPMTTSPSRGRSSRGVPAGDYPGTFEPQPNGDIVYIPPAPVSSSPAPSGGGGYSAPSGGGGYSAPAAAPMNANSSGYGGGYSDGYGSGYQPPAAPVMGPAIAPPPPPTPSRQSRAVDRWNELFGQSNASKPNQRYQSGQASPVASMPAMPKPAAPAAPAAPAGVPLMTPDGTLFGTLTTNAQGKTVVKRATK